ncbi:MAG: RnfABCDGE type electron transport complex subunit B [Gammaproteobacteria bacterium]|nr:RnfABCDGE type electron transport complex subunit B [Gammaproteobacteria bacterium]
MTAGVDELEALLPQTQCRQCGHAGCAPYAAALITDDAPIDACIPGGPVLVAALAAMLGRNGPRCRGDGALLEPPAALARIREAECIGCVKCLDVCPVDALVGAARQVHTVIAAQCTGCALCLPPCPVDCIELVPAAVERPMHGAAERSFAAVTRARAAARSRRLAAGRRSEGPELVDLAGHDGADLRAAVDAAVRRARTRHPGSRPA